MRTFQQTCPSCSSTLELPVEADGKQAICPACDHHFVASALSGQTDQTPPPAAAMPQPLPYRRVEIETVFQQSQTVMIERLYPMFWPFLLALLVLFIGFVLPIGYLSELASTRQRRAVVLLIAFSPLLAAPVSYAFCIAFALARRNLDATAERATDELSFQHWAAPTFRSFLSMCLAVICAGGIISILVVVATLLVERALSIATLEIKLVLMGITLVFCAVAFLAAALRFWPVMPLIASGTRFTDAVRQSFAMTQMNLMTSFYLVAVCSFLLTLGMSLMGVGLLVSVPLVALMASVAQRRICEIEIPALDAEAGS